MAEHRIPLPALSVCGLLLCRLVGSLAAAAAALSLSQGVLTLVALAVTVVRFAGGWKYTHSRSSTTAVSTPMEAQVSLVRMASPRMPTEITLAGAEAVVVAMVV